MVRTFIRSVTILLLVVFTAPAYSAGQPSWLDKTEQQLRLSVPAPSWNSVSTAASCYRSTVSHYSKKPFEISYVLSMMQQRTFHNNCFSLLDEVVKREKELERGRSLLEKDKNLPKDHRVRNEALQDYRFLRCRLRVMAALARAGIAGRMAESGGLAYASQAMESAIDTLKEAAEYADRPGLYSKCLGSPNPSSEQIKLLRSNLLSIWDASQKRADVKPLAEMDLYALTKELLPVKTK